MTILIDGSPHNAQPGERLVDVIGRAGVAIPHVCYHPQLGPIQTCDTCLVEVDGELVRACATPVFQDMTVRTTTPRAQSARTQAFDRILANHLLYCTVCDNNNGNCTVHNTTKMLSVEHQSIPFKTKPCEIDDTNPFYRYDPDQCILCGRCVGVGGGEKGHQFSGREGATCGVTLWPPVGAEKGELIGADRFFSQVGFSSLLTSGVR